MTILSHLNYLSVAVATIAYFMLGWLWYTMIFQKSWMEGHKITMPATEEEKKAQMKKMMPLTIISSLAVCFILTLALAYLIEMSAATAPHAGWMLGCKMGVLAAVFAALPLKLSHLHTGKKMKVIMIDAGYHVVGLVIAGIILSVMHA